MLRLDPDTSPAVGGATLAHRFHLHARLGELFYVAADMTTLARHTAARLCDYRLTRDDQPDSCCTPTHQP